MSQRTSPASLVPGSSVEQLKKRLHISEIRQLVKQGNKMKGPLFFLLSSSVVLGNMIHPAAGMAQTAPPSGSPTPLPVAPTGPATPGIPFEPVTPGLVQPPAQTPSRTLVTPLNRVNPTEDAYILGVGDQIGLDIFDVPELSGANGRYVILVDGSVNLPWVGRVLLQGLTVNEAADVITQAYAPFIRNPLITLNLLSARSLRISVAGEVKRPGAYVLSPEGDTTQILVGDVGAGGNQSQWPTVSLALQSAGGITPKADLRRVQVYRPQPNGPDQLVAINLWDLILTGQLQQDLRLRDGDRIVIPTAADLSPQEALLLGSANFAPESIRVNVVGAAGTPGTVEVATNTSLNQALLSAGGFDPTRADREEVQLVRLNPNGTAIRRTISVDLTAGLNEETNPSLQDGDTIIVSRSGTATFRDNLENVTGPFGGILGIINGLFGLF